MIQLCDCAPRSVAPPRHRHPDRGSSYHLGLTPISFLSTSAPTTSYSATGVPAPHKRRGRSEEASITQTADHQPRKVRKITRRKVRRFRGPLTHSVARSVLILGVPKSHVTVIYNGLPPIGPIPAPPGRATFRIGIIGQIGPWKGHEDLFQALNLLARDRVRAIWKFLARARAILSSP